MLASHSDMAAKLRVLFRETAREAGLAALAYFRAGQATRADVWSKAGGSPVTEADIALDRLIAERLRGAMPEAGWLSEETADDPARLSKSLVFVVDPIDGTRAFMQGGSDWAISIALLLDGAPLAAILHAPALGVTYEAHRGSGALRNGEPLPPRAAAASAHAPMRVAGPAMLTKRLLPSFGAIDVVPKIPSLALRLARVADGALDVGLASANAHDWDIAASDLILSETGAALTGLTGERPGFNRPSPVHSPLVASPRTLHPRVLEALAEGATA